MRKVAALFVRADSIYKSMAGVDCWDIERDARTWPGGAPVVAHPPCRAWGRLAHMAKPRPDEKDLACWAVAQVRRWGGVLEHPRSSNLWPDQGLPASGAEDDDFGGWTIGITQHWFGHRATKPTLLYICGLRRSCLPTMPPMMLGDGTHVIAQDRRRSDGTRDVHGRWPEIGKAEREHTPRQLAEWLVELARGCNTTKEARDAA